MPPTDDQIIYNRIQAGKRSLKRHVRRDTDYVRRFKDPSVFTSWVYGKDDGDDGFEDDGDDVPAPAAVGNIPYIQTNIRTKAAAICFTDADWYDETVDPMVADIPKEVLKTLWRERNWSRITKKAYLKRFISGMGCVCCYWRDPVPGKPFGGPQLEHVQLKDLAIDPHVVDWNDLRWGARRIMMPRDEAIKAWPEYAVELGGNDEETRKSGNDARKSSACELWVYWDAETEAVFHQSKCLQKDPNLYGCVPLIFAEGDLDPSSEYDKGDFDAATGLQVMMTYADDLLNNMARHGGSIMLYDTNKFEGKDEQSMQRGLQQGMLGIDGDPEGAIIYTPTEPMNPTLLEIRRNVQNGIDAAQGVNQYMRGVVQNESKFATEVAATEGQSGARGDQDRKEYENFLNRIARMVIRWIIQFSKPATPDEFILIEALQQITSLQVVEQSTSYKNPEAQFNKAVLLLNTLLPIAQAVGLNIRPLIEDVLIAAGKRNVNRYFGLPAPQSPEQQGQPGAEQPGMPPTQPGAEGGGGLAPAGPPTSPNPGMGGI